MDAGTARGTRDQRYAFVVLLRDQDSARMLAQLLEALVTTAAGGNTNSVVIVPRVRGAGYLDRDQNVPWRRDIPEGTTAILLMEHTAELPERLAKLQGAARVYVGSPEPLLFATYKAIPNVRTLMARQPVDFIPPIMADFSSVGIYPVTASSRLAELDRLQTSLARNDAARRRRRPPDVPRRATTPSTRETDLLTGLLQANLTLSELSKVAELEDDPEAAELVGSWFDARREVALAMAGLCLGGVVATFVGDATVIATTHGVFTKSGESSAIIGMTSLMSGCAICAGYYLNKVRRLAEKSLCVRHILHRRAR